jgi:hypothetical protein
MLINLCRPLPLHRPPHPKRPRPVPSDEPIQSRKCQYIIRGPKGTNLGHANLVLGRLLF